MSDYIRTTRDCTLDSMRPELAAGIRRHIEQHELGDLAGTALACCETTSVKPKKGLLGKGQTICTGVLLTPHWLVWATGEAGKEPGVLSARLRNLEIHDYEKTPYYKMVPDSGLDLLGQYTGMSERGSTFIGLGPEPAAAQFRQLVRDAHQKANA